MWSLHADREKVHSMLNNDNLKKRVFNGIIILFVIIIIHDLIANADFYLKLSAGHGIIPDNLIIVVGKVHCLQMKF